MTVWKGGRGVKAPYETTHVRIPVAIKQQVEELSKAYKDGTLNELNQPASVDEQLSFDDAVELARQILKKKKSARVSIESLLTGIYGKQIKL